MSGLLVIPDKPFSGAFMIHALDEIKRRRKRSRVCTGVLPGREGLRIFLPPDCTTARSLILSKRAAHGPGNGCIGTTSMLTGPLGAVLAVVCCAV